MKKVIIYTGPRCAHCAWAKDLLKKKNINYEEFDISLDPSKREEMLTKSNGMITIPQIFIENHHVGGNRELQALEREGKLDSLLKD